MIIAFDYTKYKPSMLRVLKPSVVKKKTKMKIIELDGYWMDLITLLPAVGNFSYLHE